MNCRPLLSLYQRLSLSLLCVATLTAAGHAQLPRTQLQVSVPFAFESGSHHLPPGSYILRIGQGHLLSVEGERVSAVSMALPDEDRAPAIKSSVIFRRYGDHYFLREVWVAGKKTHTRCVPTHAEKQIQLAMRQSAAGGVVVALLESPR